MCKYIQTCEAFLGWTSEHDERIRVFLLVLPVNLIATTDHPETHGIIQHRERGPGLGPTCADHARKLLGALRGGYETIPEQEIPHSWTLRRP